MQVGQYTYNTPITVTEPSKEENIDNMVAKLGEKVLLPDANRNYTIFNTKLVNKIVDKKEKSLPIVLKFLETAKEEKQIAEGLYVLDRMADIKVKGIETCYPTIAKFNDTESPTVQVLLAGIYRKTLVPDAFGPLMKMIVKDSIQTKKQNFDPTEEIGGAILEYIRADKTRVNEVLNNLKNAQTLNLYSQKPDTIFNNIANA